MEGSSGTPRGAEPPDVLKDCVSPASDFALAFTETLPVRWGKSATYPAFIEITFL